MKLKKHLMDELSKEEEQRFIKFEGVIADMMQQFVNEGIPANLKEFESLPVEERDRLNDQFQMRKTMAYTAFMHNLARLLAITARRAAIDGINKVGIAAPCIHTHIFNLIHNLQSQLWEQVEMALDELTDAEHQIRKEDGDAPQKSAVH